MIVVPLFPGSSVSAFQARTGPMPLAHSATHARSMPFSNFLSSLTTSTLTSTSTSTTSLHLGEIISSSGLRVADVRRKDWIDKSVKYYSTVMRQERRRLLGQAKDWESSEESKKHYMLLASEHYFALRKIKDGKPLHAETIYRRIINELVQEMESEAAAAKNGVDTDHHACDHAPLAVTTLLLALLMQRMGDTKKTRSVFLNFFRIAVLDAEPDEECACSAKVLQAYALFEMKQGNALKSLELVHKAVHLDPSLQPVLQWKQFRDVLERRTSNDRSKLLRP
jgi:hypothetical protein